MEMAMDGGKREGRKEGRETMMMMLSKLVYNSNLVMECTLYYTVARFSGGDGLGVKWG